MRLSDAIALGRTLIKSVPYTRWNSNGGGCALGMAESAFGLKRYHFGERNYGAMWESSIDRQPGFEWMLSTIFRGPCPCELNHCISTIIAHTFNDHVHGDRTFTLDQLIDWVRSVEPEESPSPTVALAESCSKSEVCP